MANLSFFSLFFIFCQIQWIISQKSEKNPSKIIETTYGKLQGFEFTLDNGKFAEIFLGIPFAQPPTEKNRFEKPRVLSKFEDLKEVKEWKPGCIRFAHVYQDEHQTSEDCLYLNIFAPKEPSPNENGYPVLFWIHGGGYRDGSASAHGYQVLANHFVSRGIIVVNTQYRLGPIGFAAWGDDNFPGNYGIWDLWAALRYVKRNIKNFGGDASRVTIWGESAGAAAVSALTLSKHTRDLFSYAIQNSGSQFAEWANSNRVIQSSEGLAKKLQCETADSLKMKNCLKTKSVEEIVEVFNKLGQDRRRDMNPIKYQPRLDADFFTNDLPNLVAESPKKPTMIGIAELESLWFTSKPYYGIDLKNIDNYSRENFVDFVKTFVNEKTFPKKSKEVEKRVVEFYLNKNEPSVKDGIFYFKKFTELHSDLLFNIPILNEVKIKAENGWKMFTYLTRYINKNAFPKEYPNKIRKSLHAYEYPYIFNISSLPLGKQFTFDEDDKEFIRILIDTMVNFIKNGNPSTDDIDWQPATENNKFRYLELKPFGPQMKEPLWPDKIQFWTLLNKHYEFDIIRGIHKKTLRSRDEL